MQTTYTLAEAQRLPDLGFMSLDDLSVPGLELDVLHFRWLCLLALDGAGACVKAKDAAAIDLLGDADLLVMLSGPVAKFRAWFGADDHGIYEMTVVTGCEAWAAAALARVPAGIWVQ